MRVILLADVPQVGRKNQIKEVRDGFARNFLLPRKLAVPATDEIQRELASKQSADEEKRAKEKSHYEEIAGRLKKETIHITLKVGEKGRAFGALTHAKIREALATKGFPLEKEWIELEEPIKTIGEKKILIKFPQGITGTATFLVEAE